MALPIQCGNCRGHFMPDELARRTPPRHPWPLSSGGEAAFARNQQLGGDPRRCPECGNQTLLAP